MEKCYGIEINVGKTKVMRISKLPSPIRIMIEKNGRTWNISTTWAA
jgi:hypothetical protein